MRGLLVKEWRDVWFPTLCFGLGLATILGLLTHVVPQVLGGMGTIFQQMPFVKTLLSVMIGTEIGDSITARAMQAFIWVHPVVLTLLWAHEIMLCTRLPAGEIDRGTIDFLLGLPVSRRRLYVAQTISWLATGLVLFVAAGIGHWLASSSMPNEMNSGLVRVIMVLANLFMVYVAVGGIALFVSACSDRRGRAVGVVFAVVLFSFFVTFLGQFWEPAESFTFLSLLQYYQPADLIQHGDIPWSNLGVLSATGSLFWLAGCEVFARRSICTV